MAELVGLIASILQLFDTVAKARNYVQGFRDAPRDQQRLLKEIQNLAPLIRKLEERISSNGAAMITEMMPQYEQPLNELKVTMERLTKKLDLDGIREMSRRSTWYLWGKEDVQEGLNTIERCKTMVNAWLALDIWFVAPLSAVFFFFFADLPQECYPRQALHTQGG
jgi:UDP-glucose 6-dehydrogenase